MLAPLHWRDYLGHTNPLVAALMARMHIVRRERWQVKVAALKQMIGLSLNAEQRRYIQLCSLPLPRMGARGHGPRKTPTSPQKGKHGN